jgi:DNA-binding transcriptional MerR regulator
MTTRTYHSIGDVLTLLRGEFPDITISKIRFLESQGLVSPQRSPSGYRKFYDEDIERLRYVLTQQREHFLPLKVIRDRLNGVVSDEDTGAGDPAPASAAEEPPATKAPESAVTKHNSTATSAPVRTAAASTPTVADVVAALQETPAPRSSPAKAPAHAPRAEKTPAPVVTETPGSMTEAELSAETGLSEAEIRSLVEFGILREASVAGLACFDAGNVAVARLATGFLAQGIEPRHLRLYRNAVDREMGLIEQVVTPLLRQRNPEARARAEASSDELSQLGRDLRIALLAIELDQLLDR